MNNVVGIISFDDFEKDEIILIDKYSKIRISSLQILNGDTIENHIVVYLGEKEYRICEDAEITQDSCLLK